MAEREPLRELPSMIDGADDRPSVTETDGKVARFDMAFDPKPSDRFVFRPPVWQRLPSLLFLGFAAALAVAAVLAYSGSSNTALYRYFVVEHRTPLVFVIVLAAIATFVRSGMRGVIVTGEGVETRDLSMGFPRVRRYRWAQVDRVILDKDAVLLELWNGTYERLPRVSDGERLVDLLGRVAAARGRDVTRLDRAR
jgi:hypothetical protein